MRSSVALLRMPVWTLYEQSILSNSEQSRVEESKNEIKEIGVLSSSE